MCVCVHSYFFYTDIYYIKLFMAIAKHADSCGRRHSLDSCSDHEQICRYTKYAYRKIYSILIMSWVRFA